MAVMQVWVVAIQCIGPEVVSLASPSLRELIIAHKKPWNVWRGTDWS